ncbi:MAG: hypothetical protein JWR80_312 [Bradyrhizobium sp.]|nr:hypothetical protein [Bradyrhizobium sp.]
MSSFFASKFMGAALAVAATVAVATPASATVTTFATFAPVGSAANVIWNNAGSTTNALFNSTATGGSIVVAPRLVSFSFVNSGLAQYFTNAQASFTLNASETGNPAATVGGFIVQDGVGGSFSFKTTTAVTIGGTTYAIGSNLLSGTFGGTSIFGSRGGTTAGFTGDTAVGDSVFYTSDFLSFAGVNDSDFNIGLNVVTPALNAVPTSGTPTSALRTFRAVANGAFSTDPAATVTAAVPEPATWLMMILGFCGIGLGLRGRRNRIALTTA